MSYLSLKYFLAVASKLSFSQAARELHISQPALSQQISSLENKLGVQLFHRNTHKITLTKEGEYLYIQLKPYFKNIDYTIEQLVQYKTVPIKRIKIATIPTAASKYMPFLFEKALEFIPNIEIFLLETSSPNGEMLVKNQEYDIAFIRTPTDKIELANSNVSILELKKYPLKFIVSTEHPLSNYTSINLQKASDDLFIHYDEKNAPSLHYLFKKVCTLAALTPKKLCTVSELFTIHNLVANNLGVAIIPEDVIKLVSSQKIRVLDIQNIPELFSSISIIWNNLNHTSLNIVEKIISFMKKYQQ